MQIKDDISSPNLIIEKGAIFDGRCSMPNLKPSRSICLFGVTVKKKAKIFPTLIYTIEYKRIHV
jgi:cytoskeletal protein CcmA (bactofilin family)